MEKAWIESHIWVKLTHFSTQWIGMTEFNSTNWIVQQKYLLSLGQWWFDWQQGQGKELWIVRLYMYTELKCTWTAWIEMFNLDWLHTEDKYHTFWRKTWHFMSSFCHKKLPPDQLGVYSDWLAGTETTPITQFHVVTGDIVIDMHSV